MRKIETEEIKKIANDILRYIKRVCEENQISYCLAYGTCLGAVRHEGFIPWDDDIDIYMTRQEYNRFALAMRQQPQSPYRLLFVDTKTYTLPLAKVVDTRTVVHQVNQREKMPLGVYVDVFILDNIPDEEATCLRFFRKLEKNEKLWNLFQYKRDYSQKRGLKNRIKAMVYSCVSPRIFAVRQNRISQKYAKKQVETMGSIMYADGTHALQRFPNNIFENLTTAAFEGDQYPIPQNYDAYLTQIYGDWRKLPPEEDRVTNHSMCAYIKDAQ